MYLRKITSLTLLISFVPLMLTSIVLYIVPEGRVAYWSDWHLLGLTKTQWGDVHINLGFLFLAAGSLHLFYNWKAMIAYMKNKARELRIFTPAFTVALLVNCFLSSAPCSTCHPSLPSSSLGHSFKEAAAVKYGEPPYGHAELSSLALFSKRTGLELESHQGRIDERGNPF